MIADRADAGDDTGAGRLAVVRVVRDEQTDLQKARARIAQPGDPLAGGQLSLLVLSRDLVGPAPFPELRFECSYLAAQLTKSRRGHTSCRSRSVNHSRM